MSRSTRRARPGRSPVRRRTWRPNSTRAATSTRGRLAKRVARRPGTFVARSDALYRLPALQEVAALHDQSDFGLGDEQEDRARLARIHENLKSADWVALTRTRPGDVMAVGDYKG